MVTFDMRLGPALMHHILFHENGIEKATPDDILNLQVPYEIAVGYGQSVGILPDPEGKKGAYKALLERACERFYKLTGQRGE